jgi:hypothetical protein
MKNGPPEDEEPPEDEGPPEIYYTASETVILSAIFFTNGVIIMVIGKPIANVVKNMPNHISKKL